MPTSLPTNIDATYIDNAGDASVQLHQQYHDTIHTYTNNPTVPVNAQTASYTLVLADAAYAVEMNVGSANNLTVPPNSSVAFPVGTSIVICQIGAGVTTIVAGSGVTINTASTLILRAQWSTVVLRKRATDSWVLSGDTT